MNVSNFQQVEKTKLDYKQSLEEGKPRSWLKSVSAFANTQGGHLLFGVTDDDTHKAIGLKDAQTTASKISELISARIEPRVQYELTEFDSDTPGTVCLELHVFCGSSCPYYYSHEQTRVAYVRHGDRSEPATTIELNNLILRGQNITFDALPSKYKLSDVSFTLLGATYKKITEEAFNMEKDLLSMNLVDENNIVTNAGVLLCDQGYFRQSKVVCTRWKGKLKGAVDGDALDDQEFKEASLIMLLANVEAFIRNNSKHPWTVQGMQREENSDYPFRAVREVLVNAMIHRDYQNIGAEVHIDMFDDRMEITSPGGMMNGSRIQECNIYRVPSMRRNEIISDAFGRLHYMDRRGSGFGRILGAYAGLIVQPQFFSDEYSFIAILPNRGIDNGTNAGKMQLSSEKMPLTGEKMPLDEEKLLLKGENKNSLGENGSMQFKKNVMGKANDVFRGKTIELLVNIFNRYEYAYTFNRRNIAEGFGMSEGNASRLIRKCVDFGIMQKEKKDVYFFIKPLDYNK